MSDDELAQDITQQFTDKSLQAHMAARGKPRVGRSACVECSDPISAPRQAIGADRCLDCQKDDDLRNRDALMLRHPTTHC